MIGDSKSSLLKFPTTSDHHTMRTNTPNTSGILSFMLCIFILIGVYLFMSNRVLLGRGEENDVVLLKQTFLDHRTMQGEHRSVKEKLAESQTAYVKLNTAYKATQKKLAEGLENYVQLERKSAEMTKQLQSVNMELEAVKAERDGLKTKMDGMTKQVEEMKRSSEEERHHYEEQLQQHKQEQLKQEEEQKQKKKENVGGDTELMAKEGHSVAAVSVVSEPTASSLQQLPVTDTTHKPEGKQPLEKQVESKITNPQIVTEPPVIPKVTAASAAPEVAEVAEVVDEDTAAVGETDDSANEGFGDAGWPREPFRQDVLEGGIVQT